MKELTGEIEFSTTITIPKQRIADLLDYAFEGGSNYWYIIREHRYPEGKTVHDYEFAYLELPLTEGGALVIDDKEDERGAYSGKILDLAAIKRGLALLNEKYSIHFADLMSGNEDADTGDVFLQLCLFGEVVFG